MIVARHEYVFSGLQFGHLIRCLERTPELGQSASFSSS
jgi:hypothetical protein